MTARYCGTTYAAAEAFLAGGRRKDYRPSGRANTYLARVDAHTIALVLHSTAVVVYHDDGTLTLQTDDWLTVTTQDRIGLFSPVKPHSTYRKGAYGREWTLGGIESYTPSRVQKCRTCRGHGGDVSRKHCYGARYDWQSTTPRRRPCEHGMTSGHDYGDVQAYECYRCHGEGVTDYGNRPIYEVWHGQPIRIEASGAVVDWHAPYVDAPSKPGSHHPSIAHHYYSTPTPVPAPYTAGAEVQQRLEATVPGLLDVVTCPCPCRQTGTVSNMIVHLNDGAKWTREAIADWLDTLDSDLRFPTTA